MDLLNLKIFLRRICMDSLRTNALFFMTHWFSRYGWLMQIMILFLTDALRQLRPRLLALFLPPYFSRYLKAYTHDPYFLILLIGWCNVVQKWWRGRCCYCTWAWPLETKSYYVLFHCCPGMLVPTKLSMLSLFLFGIFAFSYPSDGVRGVHEIGPWDLLLYSTLS